MNQPNQTQGQMSRDRPTSNPGGVECQECGCIFIGDPDHQFCAVCVEVIAAQVKDAQDEIPEGWCPICGNRDGSHKSGCEDGSEIL